MATEKRTGSRLGFDPLAEREARGVDGLIRDTRPEATTHTTPTASTTSRASITPTAHTASKTPGTKGTPGERLPRLTMAYAPEHIEYLQTMARYEGITTTRYVYDMIARDMEANAPEYARIRAVLNRGKK